MMENLPLRFVDLIVEGVFDWVEDLCCSSSSEKRNWGKFAAKISALDTM